MWRTWACARSDPNGATMPIATVIVTGSIRVPAGEHLDGATLDATQWVESGRHTLNAEFAAAGNRKHRRAAGRLRLLLRRARLIPSPAGAPVYDCPLSFGGFARSRTRRAQSSPSCRSFAFSGSLTRRVWRSGRPVPGGAGGRPRGRFGSSMPRSLRQTKNGGGICIAGRQ